MLISGRKIISKLCAVLSKIERIAMVIFPSTRVSSFHADGTRKCYKVTHLLHKDLPCKPLLYGELYEVVVGTAIKACKCVINFLSEISDALMPSASSPQ